MKIIEHTLKDAPYYRHCKRPFGVMGGWVWVVDTKGREVCKNQNFVFFLMVTRLEGWNGEGHKFMYMLLCAHF
jgi:hypothetical protein